MVGMGFRYRPSCWRGSMVERLICNQQVVGSIPTVSSIMQVLFNGKTSAFQAEDAGSIPATCSNKCRCDGMADLVDSKSIAHCGVGVQVPPPTPIC